MYVQYAYVRVVPSGGFLAPIDPSKGIYTRHEGGHKLISVDNVNTAHPRTDPDLSYVRIMMADRLSILLQHSYEYTPTHIIRTAAADR